MLTFIGDSMDRLHAMSGTLDTECTYEYLKPGQITNSRQKLNNNIVIIDLDIKSNQLTHYIREAKESLPKKLIGVHTYTESNIISHFITLGLTDYSNYLHLRDHIKNELNELKVSGGNL